MTKFLLPILLLSAATPALAEPVEAVTSLVQVRDLDLASEAGQRTLDKRLSQAIVEVCGDPSPADLVGQNKTRDCRQDLRARLDVERDQRIAKASTGPILVAAR
jgi:UrcA family protein